MEPAAAAGVNIGADPWGGAMADLDPGTSLPFLSEGSFVGAGPSGSQDERGNDAAALVLAVPGATVTTTTARAAVPGPATPPDIPP